MSDKVKHILIVNYDFPPNQGIGGRRWAKFAKELARRNFVVHVIKADSPPGNQPSPWQDDVKSDNIQVHSLPRRYPTAFSHPGSDLISKVNYRIARWKLQRREKGTIYDIAIGWEQSFRSKAEELIRTYNIKNVIASGAPWYLLVYSARLKQHFPGLNLITDFRDPWLNALNYGMANLSPERRQSEAQKFHFAMEQADAITAPNAEMIRDLKGMCGEKADKHFEVLSHSFDPDDIPPLNSRKVDDSIRIVYGGDLYFGLEKQLEILRKQLDSLKQEFPDIYSRLSIRIYTNSTVPNVLRGIERVEVKPAIGKSLFNELNDADYCMIMLTDAKRNEPTTKFMEILPLRKPLLVLAPEGEITQLVRKEHLGIVIDSDDPRMLGAALRAPIQFNDSFDISRFRLDAVTDKLCALLK